MLTDGRPTEKTTWIVLPGDQSSSDQIIKSRHQKIFVIRPLLQKCGKLSVYPA